MQSTDSIFSRHHHWDRNFNLLMMGLIWLGVVMGFGPGVLAHLNGQRPAPPLIIHVHAAAFVGWLVLLTAQILLIRTNRRAAHQKLGIALALLAVVMIVIGPLAEYMIQMEYLGTSRSRPGFMSVAIAIMIVFAAFTGIALKRRADSALHKRLMLMATIYIASAGFARWTRPWTAAIFGNGFAGTFATLYLGIDLLYLCIAAYDLKTRGRLHPAFLTAMGWVLASQLLSVWLLFQPWWVDFCTRWVSP